MEELFITKIHIDNIRNLEHLKNIDIVLSETEKKHLILTGKNGCGKTSLLRTIKQYVEEHYKVKNNTKTQFFGENFLAHLCLTRDDPASDTLNDFNFNIKIDTNKRFKVNDTIFVHIPADRFDLFDIPQTIEKIPVGWHSNSISKNYSNILLKYMVYLRNQMTEARIEQNCSAEVKTLEKWFGDFENILKKIYDIDELELKYDRKNLSFIIKIPGHQPFGLNQMADGFFSFVKILTELMIRMDDYNDTIDFAKNAIVLIDEIETHLHIDLQKKVLPILIELFPNIQFIVTTHSPFVIASLENAVAYDLEDNKVLENPSQFSYESIIEGYYGIEGSIDRLGVPPVSAI